MLTPNLFLKLVLLSPKVSDELTPPNKRGFERASKYVRSKLKNFVIVRRQQLSPLCKPLEFDKPTGKFLGYLLTASKLLMLIYCK